MIEKAGACFPTLRDHFRWFHCCLSTDITSGSRNPPPECSSISEKHRLWKVKGINGVLAMSIRKSEGIIASHARCCRQLGRGSESVFCKEGGEHQSICVLTRWPTISSSFFFREYLLFGWGRRNIQLLYSTEILMSLKREKARKNCQMQKCGKQSSKRHHHRKATT